MFREFSKRGSVANVHSVLSGPVTITSHDHGIYPTRSRPRHLSEHAHVPLPYPLSFLLYPLDSPLSLVTLSF
jgi:hypothetical protein